ncbi:MAG TPA: hypothetical protein VGL40_00855 [Bacillota bacterium]
MKIMSILSLILLLVEIGSGFAAAFCTGSGQPINPSQVRLFHLVFGLITVAVTGFTLIWAMLKVSRKGSR